MTMKLMAFSFSMQMEQKFFRLVKLKTYKMNLPWPKTKELSASAAAQKVLNTNLVRMT
jgi:hypothetical protein